MCGWGIRYRLGDQIHQLRNCRFNRHIQVLRCKEVTLGLGDDEEGYTM